jgi:adenosylcobinamide-GDP ribazoletransferase
MKAIAVAAAFLTRLPIRVAAGATDVAGAVRWFPLIGGALGVIAALSAWVLRELLILPAPLTATLVVGFGAWVTGAIHLDGLADTADGFGGGHTREEVLRIMRDPAVGSYGALAVLFVVSTRMAAVSALLDRGAALPFLVAAPAVARWTISLLAAWLPYARSEDGLGRAVTHQRDRTGPWVSTTVAFLVVFVTLGMNGVFVVAVSLLTAIGVGRAARRRIGGVTGDVFGATVELSETAVLLTGVVLKGARWH